MGVVMGVATTIPVERAEWGSLAAGFHDLTYRQGGAYGDLAAASVGARSEFVKIVRDGRIAGLANVRIKKMPLLPLGLAYVNHGPLTSRDGTFQRDAFSAAVGALAAEYVKRRGLVLRIVAPLMDGTHTAEQRGVLAEHGFKDMARTPYETMILDLDAPLDVLRKKLDGKWRGHLSKAERSNLTIERSTGIESFEQFAPLFFDLAKSKGFTAVQDIGFFTRTQRDASGPELLEVHLARRDGEIVAGHVGSFLGGTAVYLLGATTPAGREARASYLLQWTVIQRAKAAGMRCYDLGGVDEADNPSVYLFKKGMSGRPVRDAGVFERAPHAAASLALSGIERCVKRYLDLRSREGAGHSAEHPPVQ